MKSKIKNFLKNNKIAYKIYKSIGSLLVNLLKLFVKPDDKLILFVSYGGIQYEDSPKYIYEYMKQNEKFKNYKFIWAFTNPNNFNIPQNEKVKIDTLRFYIYALKSKFWVTNTSVTRGLKFKGKNTIYVNTWHGTPIKTVGKHTKSKKDVFNQGKNNYLNEFDLFLAQGNYEANIYSNAFNIPKEKILLTGLPRNDNLLRFDKEEKKSTKDKLAIDRSKKVILYAPTFREREMEQNLRVDFKKWREKLSADYIVLYRDHHSVGIKNDYHDEFIIDVTAYPSVNELLKITDVLISDYSSIIFDYSLLNRPIFCYIYDIGEYKKERGLYIDLPNELPNSVYTNEDDLLNAILELPNEKLLDEISKFNNKYIQMSGTSTKQILDILFPKK